MPYITTGYRIRIERLSEYKYEFAEDKPIIKRESLSECVLLNEEEAHEVIKRYFAGETP